MNLPKLHALAGGPVLIRQASVGVDGVGVDAINGDEAIQIVDALATTVETVEVMQAQEWADTLTQSSPGHSGTRER